MYLQNFDFKHDHHLKKNLMDDNAYRKNAPSVNPNGLGAIQILRDAFQKYIVDTAIESNTIAIQIVYREIAGSPLKSMFITRRQYNNDNSLIKQEIPRINHLKPQDFTNSHVFSNDQLDTLITRIQTFKLIKSIILVEIYNDTPFNRTHYNEHYYPFTIPIKVLFNDNVVEPSPFFNQYKPGDICGICQDTLKNSEEHPDICINEDCQHGFHCDCIQAWFDNRRQHGDFSDSCPACRRRFISTPLTPGEQNALPDEEAPDAFGHSFGKGVKRVKSKLKAVNKDIIYLK